METSVQEDEYMTAGEAAVYLGVSKAKMARLLASGVLPYRSDELDSRYKMVKRADVMKLARDNRRRPKNNPRAAA